jgi:hypothetical protein
MFNNQQPIDKPKAAGFQRIQAEAVICVIAETQDAPITQAYFDHKLEKELALIKAN